MHFAHATLMDRFRRVQAVVLGDAMLDVYTHGVVSRFCPEGPVSILDAHSTQKCAGGAANTACNLAALGARTTLLSTIGLDAEGEQLTQLLKSQGIHTAGLLRSESRQTLTKHRLLAGQQLLMRVDKGSTASLDQADEERMLTRLHQLMQSCDLIVVSDYAYVISHRGLSIA